MIQHFLNPGMRTYSLPMVCKIHTAQVFTALRACYLGNAAMVSALDGPFSSNLDLVSEKVNFSSLC